MSRPQFVKISSFFEYFSKNIIEISDCGCWIWIGSSLVTGYGEVKVSGRRMLAHRVAAIASGKLTDLDKVVRHVCDIPACVNPDHLAQGDQADNVADMVIRNRQSYGVNRPKAKLTDKLVGEIKSQIAMGISQSEIARRFSVTQARISRINTGKIWRHVQ